MPRGRNGFGPELSLSYSSGFGNGPFGLGWQLRVPSIARKTSKGVPSYDDARDAFVLSGAEDLVEVPGEPGRYRPVVESVFARIVHRVTADGDRWHVWGRDGLRHVYGAPDGAAAPAVVEHPSGRPFRWQLARTEDQFGNRIEYSYRREPGSASLYLDEIRYADHGDREAPEFLVRVRFAYAKRPDVFIDRRAGFELATTLRCTSVEIVCAGATSRVYHLDYADAGGVSLLAKIRCEGRDGARLQWLPPLEFGYTDFAPAKRRPVPLTGELPERPLGAPGLALADLAGGGLPDFVEVDGGARYWRNRGAGRFAPPREMARVPSVGHLATGQSALVDANGDGRPDLLVSDGAIAGYFPLAFDARWDVRSFRRYERAPTFGFADRELRLVDLDGDGVTDAVRSGSRLECFCNDPGRGWRAARSLMRREAAAFPDVRFSDPRVQVADMTGDGAADIVLIHGRRVDYWPWEGPARWGARVTMRGGPELPDGYDPARVLLGDVDGDGAADLVYVEDTRVRLWRNRGGAAWEQPTEITGTPALTAGDSVWLVDLLGSGVAGVLWSRQATAAGEPVAFFLDLTGGTKPYLLNRVDNHTGAVTLIEYAPSTAFWLADDRKRSTRWRTPLPFPVQVVRRVETIDRLSGGKLTSEYAYHHGAWDGAEREFRGFGRVDQHDSEAFADYSHPGLHGPGEPFTPVAAERFSPPTVTRTWFHVGPLGDAFSDVAEVTYEDEYWGGDPPALTRPDATRELLAALPRPGRRAALRALAGRMLRQEVYVAGAAAPLTVTEWQHALLEAARGVAFFACTVAERATRWEGGEDPMAHLRTSAGHDMYGRPASELELGVPRGRDYRASLPAATPHEPYLATLTRFGYAQRDDADLYIVDRVASRSEYALELSGYEAAVGRSPPATELAAAAHGGTVAARVIGQTLTLFDGPAFAGLPFGQLGDYGAPSREERLVLTDGVIDAALREDGGDAWRPPYLDAAASGTWTGYPAEFQALTGASAGYVARAGRPHEPGLFAASSRKYDFHDDPSEARGLLLAERDAFGNETRRAYDAYGLLPVAVTDPLGLTTTMEHDYRVLAPSLVTDPNGTRTRWRFTPLGLVESAARMGPVGTSLGDLEAEPSRRFEYELDAFDARGAPLSVRTVLRAHHATAALAPAERDRTIERRQYSDGFGRLIQTRAQSDQLLFGDEPFGDAGLAPDPDAPVDAATGRRPSNGAPRVVVSGAERHDNKGRVIERFEPFFATGWEYAPPTATERRLRSRLSYDAFGRLVRLKRPDGGEQRFVHGVPTALADPDGAAPSPWERFAYDANDNAGRTHAGDPRLAAHPQYWDTPASVLVNALGHVVRRTERRRELLANGSLSPLSELHTRIEHDARGDVVAVRDPLGRLVLRAVRDLTGAVLRSESLDGGTLRTVLDAGGRALEQRDAKGAQLLAAFDAAGRPVCRWARDAPAQAITLRERLGYGDGSSAAQPPAERSAARAQHRLGRLHRHHDEAGVVTLAYDFEGRVVERDRRVVADAPLLAGFAQAASRGWAVEPFRMDWDVPAGSTLADRELALLDQRTYATSLAYDALGRVTRIVYPEDGDGSGHRKAATLTHDDGGGVQQIDLDGQPQLERAAYDARGRPVLLAYPVAADGTGVMRRFAYDSAGLLARMRSERYFPTPGPPLSYVPAAAGAPLQDVVYSYDLDGNVLASDDRAGSVAKAFRYDSLSRLVRASGRECDAARGALWDAAPLCAANSAMRAYEEAYAYDDAGNLTTLRHTAGGQPAVQQHTLAAGSNRLASVSVGATSLAYAHDGAGNVTAETSSRHFEWDQRDRLRVFRNQLAGAEPSVHAQHLYDADGRRVLRLVRLQGGGGRVSVLIDGLHEHHRWTEAGTERESSYAHVFADERPIALICTGAPDPLDASPDVQRVLDDHLGSATVTADQAGAVVDREDYTPFGLTAFGSFAGKRRRFGGRERDEYSGLIDYGARHYAPWLGRWTSRDPAGLADGLNPYAYARSNPVSRRDPDGRQSEPARPGRFMRAPPWAAAPPEPDPEPPAPQISLVPDEDQSLWPLLGLFGIEKPSPERYDTLSAPPPPPFAYEGELYLDEAAVSPLEPGQRLLELSGVFRRVPTGDPDVYTVDVSRDEGRTWKPAGRVVGSRPPPTAEERARAEEDLRRAVDAVYGASVGLAAGLVIGLISAGLALAYGGPTGAYVGLGGEFAAQVALVVNPLLGGVLGGVLGASLPADFFSAPEPPEERPQPPWLIERLRGLRR
jgi:RHS repeat-associated protein